jgi:hypothetical protein
VLAGKQLVDLPRSALLGGESAAVQPRRWVSGTHTHALRSEARDGVFGTHKPESEPIHETETPPRDRPVARLKWRLLGLGHLKTVEDAGRENQRLRAEQDALLRQLEERDTHDDT